MAATPNLFAILSRRCEMAIKGRIKMYTSDTRLKVAVGTQSLKVLRYRGPANDSTHPWPGGGAVIAICATNMDVYHAQTTASPT
jgi:hypothetical protein